MNDRSEIFFAKAAVNAVPKFYVLVLQDLSNIAAETPRLKRAISNSIEDEYGICTDDTSVNNLLKPDIGDHYILVLRSTHNFELCLKDAIELIF